MRNIVANKNVILTVTYNQLPSLELFLNNLLIIIENRPDIEMVIMDSGSDKETVAYLKTVKLPNVEIIFHKANLGKAKAVNSFCKEKVTQNNLPKTIVSIDPDILIKEQDLDYLIEATVNLEKIGMLSMRYLKNGFAPEQNIWFPPISKKGKNNKKYKLRVPFLCNVAGGVFAIKGEQFINQLDHIFYPIKYTAAYGPDDAMLSDKFKRMGYTNAYLEGTSALHLRSADRKAKELIEHEKEK